MGYVRPRRGDDLTEEERCTWIKGNGNRCEQPRATALDKSNDGYDPTTERLCRWHEQSLVRRATYWNRSEEAPDISIEQHLVVLVKMSWVMVKELEFQVLDLGLSVDAWRINTTEDETRVSDDPKNSYVSSKRAQLHGAHPVVVQYLKEREHYATNIKTCISAGFAMKQIAIIERYVESLVASQMALAQALGHDPNDPATRQTIMDVVRSQQQQLSDLDVTKQLGAGDVA